MMEVNDASRILIVSNNALSEINNNGKTLASFFASVPRRSLSQLYLSFEPPPTELTHSHFQVNEALIVSRKFRSVHSDQSPTVGPRSGTRIPLAHKAASRNSDTLRLAREAIWAKGSWRSPELIQWLDDVDPQVVFFCAGDSAFAYAIVDWIAMRNGVRLAVYVTDDYILPRFRLSPAWWIRRALVLRRMRRTAQRADCFFTISEEMREAYKRLLRRDSQVIVNMSPSLKSVEGRGAEKGPITLVYAGGLHTRRHKTLRLLANEVARFNRENTGLREAILRIYSVVEPSPAVQRSISIPGASEYCGALRADEYRATLNSCDIPVHVESFDRRAIETTRLSLSTKIPEYLSLGKPILAIGPSTVSSMRYLRHAAHCVTQPKSLHSMLRRLLTDESLRGDLGARAANLYEENHGVESARGRFLDLLIGSEV